MVLQDGGRVGYKALIIASGSRLYAPIKGADKLGALDFKSLKTANELVGQVGRGEASKALTVGAGLIGVELSLLLVELGLKVTVIERDSWVMPRILGQETAQVVETALM